jgi:phosphoglycolate phosphatase
VGDTKTDMMTAKNAGITAVGVSWGFRDVKELKKYGADFIITSPNELINLN